MSIKRQVINFAKAGPADGSAPRLLYVGKSGSGEEGNSIIHTHTCAEVLFVTGGQGFLRLADMTVPLHANDVVIVNANVEHTETGTGENPLEYTVMGVAGLEALSFKSGYDSHFAIRFQPDAKDLFFYMRSLLKENEQKRIGHDIICRNLLEVILLQLIRDGEFDFTFRQTACEPSAECAMVRRYIENHFKENLTLDQLASVAHVNKYYLSHSFSKEYGISPINYLLSCRIKESEYLLSETSLPVSQIAGMLGFSSLSYFSQRFRRHFGVSPRQYRAQQKDE